MPATRFRPTCRYVFTLTAVMLLLCARGDVKTGAQTGANSVTLTATVSKTVALSLPPSFTHKNIDSHGMRSGNTVRLALSNTSGESPVIRVPLLVRSNSDFKISTVVEGNATITELSVSGVRATGNLVSPQAVNALDVNKRTANPLDLSQPVLVLTGPRVSLGGTLNSPNNALEITVLIGLQPHSSLQLTFVGEPE